MIIGTAREIKNQEYRVGLTPAGVSELVRDGHQVLVEQQAGLGSGFSDDDYRQAGAWLVERSALFAEVELLVKVKEPLPSEYELLRPGQQLFTYLHLAPNPELTAALVSRKVTALAYETLEKDGSTPLLQPMSVIAGRMAPLVGSYWLQRPKGGTGLLPCGMPGVLPARLLVIGAGVVGRNAARVGYGIGMETIVLNRSVNRLQKLDVEFNGNIRTRLLNRAVLLEELRQADLVVGALYATGGRTPVVIDREQLQQMRPGAVIVDVAIDQGGCSVASRPTTHDDPTFVADGVIHYCVANMPGAFPRTATQSLTNATLPYIRQLAKQGLDAALQASAELSSALNIRNGQVVHPALGAAPAS